MPTFANWLGNLLQQNELEVQRLLADETALHFLLAWSLFESKCFRGELNAKKLGEFSENLAGRQDAPLDSLRGPAEHFHSRYQDPQKLSNLMPKDKTRKEVVVEFKKCLNVPFDQLSRTQIIFLVAVVVYRFRNNIFHGAKGVGSWLRYKEQIRLCIGSMQTFVSHAETQSPTMRIQAAA